MTIKNSIRVRSASEYVIEVNDKGETISFDTSDTGLVVRLIETMDKIEEIFKVYSAKAEEIDRRPDKPRNTALLYNEHDELVPTTLTTQNKYDGSKLINDFYVEARAAMDIFLGEGACQKIFGDKNYHEMFNDLIEQLKPHFDKMGLSAKALRDRALKKHGLNRQQRRALK